MSQWPHQFTRSSEKRTFIDGSLEYRYYCSHCYTEYWQRESRPTGPCPARNDYRELKRILR